MPMSLTVRDLVAEQVERLGSKKAVAELLGVSRTMVSLYLSGRYAAVGGRVDRFEDRALSVFSDRVRCPHLKLDISRNICRSHAELAMPMSDAKALKHWIACKGCPLNPSHAKEDEAC